MLKKIFLKRIRMLYSRKAAKIKDFFVLQSQPGRIQITGQEHGDRVKPLSLRACASGEKGGRMR